MSSTNPKQLSPTRRLLEELLARPDVEEAEGDMAGERSLRVGGREFLHVHGAALLHISLTREQKAAAVASGEARVHPYAPRSGAVELHLRSEEQLPAARRLAALALERAAAMAERFPAPAGARPPA
jgi:Luciferase